MQANGIVVNGRLAEVRAALVDLLALHPVGATAEGRLVEVIDEIDALAAAGTETDADGVRRIAPVMEIVGCILAETGEGEVALRAGRLRAAVRGFNPAPGAK